MAGTSNDDNVSTNSPTEKYRGAVGTPVRKDLRPTFGSTNGAAFPSTEVRIGGVGAPVSNG